MLWISLGTWNHASGMVWLRERIYIHGYKWTPFVRLTLRYGLRDAIRLLLHQ